jgi:hypothetical protein
LLGFGRKILEETILWGWLHPLAPIEFSSR